MWQSYAEDSLIGAQVPPSKTGYNAFANLLYNQGNFSAGVRYESYEFVARLPGRFDGSGVGYRFGRYADRDRGVDVTVGNFTTNSEAGWCFGPTRSVCWALITRWWGSFGLTPIAGIRANSSTATTV